MSEEKRSGNRVVYKRGPIITALEIVSVITGVLACAALAFSLIDFGNSLDNQKVKLQLIQESRAEGATDNCRLMRFAIRASLSRSTRSKYNVVGLHNQLIGYLIVPKPKKPPTSTLISVLHLNNCIAYGHNITNLKGR